VLCAQNPVFTDFIAPGMVWSPSLCLLCVCCRSLCAVPCCAAQIITIAFAQSIGLTAVAFVMDKKSGCLDRAWSAGVRPSEMMLAQTTIQLANVCVPCVCSGK
jgi:hypothetical protein